MKKTLIIEIASVVIGALILGGLVYYKKTKEVIPPAKEPACPADVMMCPDGTSIPRTGPNCEFGICAQELPSYLKKEESTTTATIQPSEEKTPARVPFISKVSSIVSSVFKEKATTTQEQKVPVTPQTIQQPTTPTNTTPTKHTSSLNETRYSIDGNNIVDHNNNVIYTLPPTFGNSSGGTHIVNVVAVNDVAPVIGAIPVSGLPWKYYLSENTFVEGEECHFSNKIYILDTKENTRTLMYEENNNTLTSEDPRACTSEMFLLATDNEKLILKYHTLGTNMTCDSTWSEPEKTWYLDVTVDPKNTKRYYIPPAFYGEAERKENECRSTFEATSTQATTTQQAEIGG